MTQPRIVPSWDFYLLSLARAVATRSKDPNTQCGCVIADPQHHIVGTGYNGPPPDVDDNAIDWSRPAKYRYILHSEQNAILNAIQSDLSACTLYVNGPPCSRCMLLIAAKRIKRVVYARLPIQMVDAEEWEWTLRIAKLANISLELHDAD